MLKNNSCRMTVAIVTVAVLIVAAGGAAIASNMAFKINKVLFAGGPVHQGKNWVSIPYFNPYTRNCTTGANPSCGGALCQDLTLPGGIGNVTTLTILDQNTGLFQSASCPTATATTGAAFNLPLIPGKGIQIRPPTPPVWPSPSDTRIIVGSHNPATTLSTPGAGTAQIGRLWIAVPYHTTAVTSRHLCEQTGARLIPVAATVTRSNAGAAGGGFQSIACSQIPGPGVFDLELGQHYQIVNPSAAGSLNFIPAHF